MWLLDTNVVSELRKLPSGRADANVTAWSGAPPTTTCYLSAITVKELEYGVLLLERRDTAQGARLREWLDALMAGFRDRVLPIDEPAARKAAALHVPDPAPDADAYIAATAILHGLTLVTRNTADFVRFRGLRLVNPWS